MGEEARQVLMDFVNGLIAIGLATVLIAGIVLIGTIVRHFPIPSAIIGVFVFCWLVGAWSRLLGGVTFWSKRR